MRWTPNFIAYTCTAAEITGFIDQRIVELGDESKLEYLEGIILRKLDFDFERSLVIRRVLLEIIKQEFIIGAAVKPGSNISVQVL